MKCKTRAFDKFRYVIDHDYHEVEGTLDPEGDLQQVRRVGAGNRENTWRLVQVWFVPMHKHRQHQKLSE